MDNFIIYEQPMNEHIRACLRLEHLFKKAIHNIHGDSIWDSRSAVSAIINIASVLDRPDLRSTLAKEIHRQRDSLQRHLQSPDVDHDALNDILGQLESLQSELNNGAGRLGQKVRNNEFLAQVRQYLYNPGGACDFDVPAYHHWLQLPSSQRHESLVDWFKEFDLVRHVVSLLLRLIRSSGAPTQLEAQAGFYQEHIDPKTGCQLIRLRVDKSYNVHPEISSGKHRISVRFYQTEPDGHASQTCISIPFTLAYCLL